MLVSWLLAYFVLGAAYGSIYGDMQSFLDSNELMKAMFTKTGDSLESSFTATIMIVLAALVVIVPILVINKLFTEEKRERLGLLYATKVSRAKMYWWTVILAIIAGTIGLVAAAGGLGIAATTVMASKTNLTLAMILAAGMNFWPIVLFFTGLAGLILGFVPQLGKIIYLYLGYCFAISYFGGLLKLPKWVDKTSALNWPSKMPLQDFDLKIFTLVTIISCLMLLLGYYGYRQRDLHD